MELFETIVYYKGLLLRCGKTPEFTSENCFPNVYKYTTYFKNSIIYPLMPDGTKGHTNLSKPAAFKSWVILV